MNNNIKNKLFKRIVAIVLASILFATSFHTTTVMADWGMKKSKKTFYSLDKNSIDVLFVGSSVSAAAVNPYQLYDEQGINSYNLAGVAEPMNSTYFWLKEALTMQKPKVVFIEVQTGAREYEKNEKKAKKNYDWMRNGLVKVQFAAEYCESHEEANIEDYLKPFNVKELSNSLFLFPDNAFSSQFHSVTKGFAAQTNIVGIDYKGFDVTTNAYPQKYFEPYYTYLERAIKLCKKRKIAVVLYKTPETGWTCEQHNLIQAKADQHKIDFIDFNLKSTMNEIGLKYVTDGDDEMHINMNGAVKVSSYFATYIDKNYKVPDIRNTKKAEKILVDRAAFNKYMKNKKKILNKNRKK